MPPVPDSAAAGTRDGAAVESPLLPARSSVCSAEHSSHSGPAEAVPVGLPSAAAAQTLSGDLMKRRKPCKHFNNSIYLLIISLNICEHVLQSLDFC